MIMYCLMQMFCNNTPQGTRTYDSINFQNSSPGFRSGGEIWREKISAQRGTGKDLESWSAWKSHYLWLSFMFNIPAKRSLDKAPRTSPATRWTRPDQDLQVCLNPGVLLYKIRAWSPHTRYLSGLHWYCNMHSDVVSNLMQCMVWNWQWFILLFVHTML